MAVTGLASLPNEILTYTSEVLCGIEDYMNLVSSCKRLREWSRGTSSRTILRLAAKQQRVFFRPDPFLLVAATARELGHWARQSEANEARLALEMRNGMVGLLDLALEHCGLTMESIRNLHAARFDVVNPVTNIIDQCAGKQWYQTPNFWNGGVDDAYTIEAEPSETLFHLAIYGELFGPDIEAFVQQDHSGSTKLNLITRLEYVKYCIPDEFGLLNCGFEDVRLPGGKADKRIAVRRTGPFKTDTSGNLCQHLRHNNLAMSTVLRSQRWMPHWKAMRAKSGPDFQDGFRDSISVFDEEAGLDWRQRLWENVMLSRGLESLEMMIPSFQERWIDQVRQWRALIAAIETEPNSIQVAQQTTLEYPFLMGDVRCSESAYWMGDFDSDD